MIKINNLVKNYKTCDKTVHASNNVSYNFEEKGLYFILGKSGCGKTTLLNVLSGLDSYDSGDIIVNDTNISRLSERELDEYRNIHIGIIFQDFNLLTDLNVYDNLKIVLNLQDDKNITNITERDKISDILQKVGLKGYENRKISELSGGERQRIAIARCLLKNTDIIFADEPTGNLDSKSGASIFELLKDISEKCLVIVVSHDKEAAYKYGDRIINMSDGKIVSEDEGTSNYLYTFNIEKTNISRCYKNIDAQIMQDVINKYIVDATREEKITISNIDKINNKNLKESNFEKKESKNIETSNLTNKYKMKLTFSFLNKRKLRFLFTTTLLILTCVLLYFSIYISFYNKNTIIVKYLNENETKILPAYLINSYEDDFYNKVEREVAKGKVLYDDMSKELETYVDFSKVIFDQLVEGENGSVYNATIFYMSSKQGLPTITDGETPRNKEDIVISDYIAELLGVSASDKLKYRDIEYNIVGIYKTDYKEIGLKSKLNYGYSTPYFEYNCLYKYFAVYMSDECLIQMSDITDTLDIKAANFMLKNHSSQYMNGYVRIGNSDNITSDDLLEGRMPEQSNEILISQDFAEEHNLLNCNYNSKKYNFIDIHNVKYKNAYNDMMNLYEYYTDGAQIVGVIECSPERIQNDIYIEKDNWKKIIEDYYKYYYGNYVMLANSGNYEEIVTIADNECIRFYEPGITSIYEFDQLIDKIKPILYIILLITMGINFIMLVTFISISINENKRNIGILRSLGVRMRDCTHIFALEFVLIYILSIIIASILIVSITSVVNNVYMENLKEVKYCIIDNSFIIFALMCIMQIVINILSMYIPIKKIKRKKPIEIINNL